VLDMAPSLICNGHGCIYPFSADQYRRIVRWAAKSEECVRALCPTDDWLSAYDPRALRLAPFVQRARPGQTLEVTAVLTNTSVRPVQIALSPIGPTGWKLRAARGNVRLKSGATRRVRIALSLPRTAAVGRHLCSIDVEIDGQLRAEACVALVDVSA